MQGKMKMTLFLKKEGEQNKKQTKKMEITVGTCSRSDLTNYGSLQNRYS